LFSAFFLMFNVAILNIIGSPHQLLRKISIPERIII